MKLQGLKKNYKKLQNLVKICIWLHEITGIAKDYKRKETIK